MDRFFTRPISSTRLLMLVAVFLCATANHAFFAHVIELYPPSAANSGFLASFAVGYALFLFTLLALVCFRFTLKPIVIFLLVASALAAHMIDRFEVPIDAGMLHNAIETNPAEARDLISVSMVLHVLLLGILPAFIVARLPVTFRPFFRELGRRSLMILGSLVIIGLLVWSFSSAYSSFFREHKEARYYANPAGYLIAAGEIAKATVKQKKGPVKTLGLNARIPEWDVDRELLVFVVGETTRADRFSLNGYKRKTNPILEKEEVYSFTNVWSCGTSTRISVPCMFSNIGDQNFEVGAAAAIENAVDVLKHAGVNLLWRDNNSSSKGVAERIEYQPYMDPKVNTICDSECRDEGMLVGLQDYVKAHPKGDIIIILHQMGSHGPAYYQRYPKAFEKFTPACHTNELKDCTSDEINNAYDNTILYTDYFLSKVIAFLKQNDGHFQTGMLFVGDHGESLGENGLYLHGMPMMLAPDAQRHVPAIIWLGQNMHDMDRRSLAARRDKRYTHENIFHSLLGFVEMQTDLYDPKKDMFRE